MVLIHTVRWPVIEMKMDRRISSLVMGNGPSWEFGPSRGNCGRSKLARRKKSHECFGYERLKASYS
jgi:hypothetical protein